MDSPFYIRYKIKWDSLPRAEMNDTLFIWDLTELSRRRFPIDQFDRWRIINMGCNLMLYYCRPILSAAQLRHTIWCVACYQNQFNITLTQFKTAVLHDIFPQYIHTQLNVIIIKNSLYFQIYIFLYQSTFSHRIPNLRSPWQDLVVFTMYQLSECSSYILLDLAPSVT